MRWQLRAIHLYSHDLRRRDIEFDLNSVNIIPGSSGSGKSALCEIVDYSFGSSQCHIPGLVRDSTSWVGLTITSGTVDMLILRRVPATEQLSSEDIHVQIAPNLKVPSRASDITTNSNTSSLLRQLEQTLGIGNVPMQSSNPNRQGSRISARQVIPYVLQDDDVIISKTVLLRGAQDQHRLGIVESFPYFLGVANEADLRHEAELKRLLGQKATVERRLQDVERKRDQLELDLRAMATEAEAVGLIDTSVQDASPERLDRLLDGVGGWTPGSTDEANVRIADLDARKRELNRQKSMLSAQLEQARLAAIEANEFADTRRAQSRRLQTVDLFPTTDKPDQVCPFCNGDLLEQTETLTSLRQAQRALRLQLGDAERERPQIDSYISRLQQNADDLTNQLKIVRTQINAIARESQSIQDDVDLEYRRARVAGRISYFTELRTASKLAEALPALPLSVERRIEELQGILDPEVRVERLQDAQQQVGLIADEIADRLPFARAYPTRSIFLNTRDLTTGILTEQRRFLMRDIGSDENYLSLHVAVSLALHRFFKTHERPVPGFLIFDQLSRPFYPPDKMPGIVELRSTEERNELKMFFDAIFLEVERQGDLQVIVLEHAFFADDPRYLKAVGNRSFEGNKLIPHGWPIASRDEA